ncbi:Protein ALP1-like [Frankliniella fusca]|uniref:Protein ALP1-like n=1 Tax=Frankliniella fusca TaxID=407009 RepID=A0AAE1H670_9NEOP|nr:Protein ALP1-like [Frankliniella fusca]
MDEEQQEILGHLLWGAGAFLFMNDFDEDSAWTFVWEGVQEDINDFLQMHNEAFRLHFRMSTERFEDLVHVIWNHIGEDYVRRNDELDLRSILLLVVWLLPTPDTFRSVALQFIFTPPLLHYHYEKIISGLFQQRNIIKDVCQRRSSFPGVVGAIDASYIPLCSAPQIDPQRYVNRHHDYAISLAGVVDPTLLFRDIYVGEPGSLHDSRVFRRSPLSSKIGAWSLYSGGSRTDSRGPVGVGNSAFARVCVLMYFLTGRGTDLLNTRICSKLQSIQHIILANKSLKERPVTLYLPKNRGYVGASREGLSHDFNLC